MPDSDKTSDFACLSLDILIIIYCPGAYC